MKISNVKTIQEFESSLSGEIHGVYRLNFEREEMIFIRNGNVFYKLSHGIDRPRLDEIRDGIRDVMLEKLEEGGK